MIFTHLLRVLSIINTTDIDATSLDGLKQSVDAFLTKVKSENQTTPAEQVDTNIAPLLLFFDFTKDLDDQISQLFINSLTNDEITQMYPDALNKLGYVKSKTPKNSLKKKIWKTVYAIGLYKNAIDNSIFMADKNKQKIDGCDDLTLLKNARNESLEERNTKIIQLAHKFNALVVPWFEQWDKYVKGTTVWNKKVTEENKKELMKFIVEMEIDSYNKMEEYLKKCFDALFVMIDAQIKVLEGKVTPPGTPSTTPVTLSTTPPVDKKATTTSKPTHEEDKKDEDKTKTSLSKTVIALICIGVALVIIGVGIGSYYAYRKWKKKVSVDTMTFEHYDMVNNENEV